MTEYRNDPALWTVCASPVGRPTAPHSPRRRPLHHRQGSREAPPSVLSDGFGDSRRTSVDFVNSCGLLSWQCFEPSTATSFARSSRRSPWRSLVFTFILMMDPIATDGPDAARQGRLRRRPSSGPSSRSSPRPSPSPSRWRSCSACSSPSAGSPATASGSRCRPAASACTTMLRPVLHAGPGRRGPSPSGCLIVGRPLGQPGIPGDRLQRHRRSGWRARSSRGSSSRTSPTSSSTPATCRQTAGGLERRVRGRSRASPGRPTVFVARTAGWSSTATSERSSWSSSRASQHNARTGPTGPEAYKANRFEPPGAAAGSRHASSRSPGPIEGRAGDDDRRAARRAERAPQGQRLPPQRHLGTSSRSSRSRWPAWCSR